MKRLWAKNIASLLVAVILACTAANIVIQPAAAEEPITAACTPDGLQDAVDAAASGKTITWAADCTVTLSGEIFISRSLTIDGGTHRVVLQAAINSRLFTTGAGSIVLKNLTFQGGSNDFAGGAIDNLTDLRVENSTFLENTSMYYGGAIFSETGSSLTVVNSTFFQNNTGEGGSAIASMGATVDLLNNTIAFNNSSGMEGAVGGAILNLGPSGTQFSVRNSVLLFNQGNNCPYYIEEPGFYSVNGTSFSYPDSDTSCADMFVPINPGMDYTIADNGGPTMTIAIIDPNSQAIGWGYDCPPTDQRGAIRSTCDLGAYAYVTNTTLTASPAQSAQYGAGVTFTATVTPNPAYGTVTFWDGGTALGTVDITTSGVATFTTSSLSVNTHNITASYNGSNVPGFPPSTSSAVSLTITPAQITVTAQAKSKVYGDADPELKYDITGGALVGSDKLTGTLNRAAGEGVNHYAITQGTLTAGSNYELTFVGALLTINQRPISVSAVAKGKVYGKEDPALSCWITNGRLAFTDSLTCQLERDEGENAGAYPIRAVNVSAGSNYDLTFTGADLTILPAPLTITADSPSRVYGAADPDLTYTPGEPLLPGNTLTGKLSRTPGSNVGSYPITLGTLDAGDNYTLELAANDAHLSITPKPVTVTADSQRKTYGKADPDLTYTVDTTLVSGDRFTGELSRDAGEKADDYAITQGTLALSSNYTLKFNGAVLTIDKAKLTFTADNKTRKYGKPDPEFTYQVSGFQFNDTRAILVGVPALVTDAKADSPFGKYDITISAGTLQALENYDFDFVGGKLTVTAYLYFYPIISRE